jgi:opacity protein-like surface antigen
MKPGFRTLLAATALALFAAMPALAADYDPPMIIDEPVEEVPVEVGTGWYLRGDIGYNFSLEADGDFTYRTFDPGTGLYSDNLFDTADLGEGVTWGAGFGYRFTDWIRADATVDVFTIDFDGTTSSPSPCSTDPFYAGTSCRSVDTTDAVATSLMANAYVDLGTYVGLTPYVGGGLGYTYVNWDNMGDSLYCVDAGAACPGTTNFVSSSEHNAEDNWRFTYALMAGLAYDVTREIKLDVGYRYRHVDGGDMFAFDPPTQSAGATGVQGEDPGFTTHEVRVGFRYELW